MKHQQGVIVSLVVGLLWAAIAWGSLGVGSAGAARPPLDAAPQSPSTSATTSATYTGSINFFGRAPQPWSVTVWVSDTQVAGPVTATAGGGQATYSIVVPQDTATTGPRNGARPGDPLTFKVLWQTAHNAPVTFTPGASAQVNLTVDTTDVCAFVFYDANGSGRQESGEGPAAGSRLTLYQVKLGETTEVAEYTTTDQTQPHCFSGLSPDSPYKLTITASEGNVSTTPAMRSTFVKTT